MEYYPYNMAGDPYFIPVTDFVDQLHKMGAVDIKVCNLWITFRYETSNVRATISNDELVDSTIITRLREKYAEEV